MAKKNNIIIDDLDSQLLDFLSLASPKSVDDNDVSISQSFQEDHIIHISEDDQWILDMLSDAFPKKI